MGSRFRRWDAGHRVRRAVRTGIQSLTETAIAVNHIWKFYGDYAALRDITFEVKPGSCTALLGRNGAGKTTLLRTVAGLSRAAKGQVSIFGEDVRNERTR